jgi:uncharacterized YigZ family protein
MSDFLVPAKAGESELTEKRSRFLGHLLPVETEEEARAFLADMKRKYHDARHNCWCYRIHGGAERFSDDGEPQGSAGMPMLEVFRKENIENYVCVVTRYFGGVLLGTGGLSRAYSQAAKNALLAAGAVPAGLWCEITFPCPYGMLERFKNELAVFGAVPGEFGYGADVAVRAMIPADDAPALAGRIRDLSGGKISPQISEPFLRST